MGSPSTRLFSLKRGQRIAPFKDGRTHLCINYLAAIHPAMATVMTLTLPSADVAANIDRPVQTVPLAEKAEQKANCSEYEQSAAAALLGLYASSMPTPEFCPVSPAPPQKLAPPPLAVSGLQRHIDGWDSSGSGSSSPKVARPRVAKDGAPPPGSCRFQCRYPGCSKLYASTDAVRKHCRKRHFDWLRRLDQLAAHERQMPKPALYCRWGGADETA